jgi:type II secretory ATPase GspE/PulE/Tfp pilus assembly ATPase PilB-like protein
MSKTHIINKEPVEHAIRIVKRSPKEASVHKNKDKHLIYRGKHMRELVMDIPGLSREQLEIAQSEAARQRVSLRESILKLGLLDEPTLLASVGAQIGVEYQSISPDEIEPQALQAVTANIASHYSIVPLRVTDQTLWIATSDPFNPDLKREIEIVLEDRWKVEFILATSDAISKAIRKAYGLGAATVEQMVNGKDMVDAETDRQDLTDESKAHEASVVKLVNQILVDAISAGATDIHIEPYEENLKVRYRIDGLLHDAGVPNSVRFFREGIVIRIKIISSLDIAEKRLPQDGRAQVDLSNHRFDLRISVLPTRYGEAVNVRILPQGALISDLPSLGMDEHDAKKLTRLIHTPHGIILVTGPTGSGKTTTLYTCMNLLKDSTSKILTIEDPVEYDMPGLVQMQVHPSIGFTFARALRAMLRHDPDIMLVGEIRDQETAETAIRTALTGHLVFSTLHTNDAASAITRLLDMGIEPYLVASSVEAVLAQRLVRVNCPHCREPYSPEPDVAAAAQSMSTSHEPIVAYRGRGCAKCRFTGYHGRTIITELLVLSDRIRELTVTRRHASEIDNCARQQGMTSLLQSGLAKVQAGITTYEEIFKATKGSVLAE